MSGKVWVLQKHRREFQAEPIQKERWEGKTQQELVAEGSNKQEGQREEKNSEPALRKLARDNESAQHFHICVLTL
jgi:hypothetical protein